MYHSFEKRVKKTVEINFYKREYFNAERFKLRIESNEKLHTQI